MTWNLGAVLESLHDDVEHRLKVSRAVLGHPVAKGDASEGVWLGMLGRYLPRRYTAEKAFVVDSKGNFSQQIDVVIFDRQYSPFILTHESQLIVPAESVYAIFEAKQVVNSDQVKYAAGKIESVRSLHRTSLPIPTADGIYKEKEPHHILGGLLTFESDWRPALGVPLRGVLAETGATAGALDCGCVAAAGGFYRDQDGSYALREGGKPATLFLFELIARLQALATVPMIDIRAYAAWLD